MKEENLRRKVHVKAALCACLLVLCVCAGVFAALVRPSAAAQASARVNFTRRYDVAFASAGGLEVRDPFTGRQFYMPAGLAMLFTGSDAGVHAYCIQKGQEIFDTGGIIRRAYSLYDGMFSRLTATAKENIALVALFGYPNRNASQLGTDQATAHAATQLLLWEAQLGYRNSAFERTDGRIADAYFAGGANAGVKTAYEAMARRIQEFLRTPSFLQGKTLVLELTYDAESKRYTQRFTDTSNSNAELSVTGGRRDGAARGKRPHLLRRAAAGAGNADHNRAHRYPLRGCERAGAAAHLGGHRLRGGQPVPVLRRRAAGALLARVPAAREGGACHHRAGDDDSAALYNNRNYSTTAECTTIRTTTTAIISTETTTGTTHSPTTKKTTAATIPTTVTTAAATTATTAKKHTTKKWSTLPPTCVTSATACPTTCPTTRSTEQSTTQSTQASTVAPPRTGETHTAPVLAMLLCMGLLGACLARRGKEEQT